jgi:transposase
MRPRLQVCLRGRQRPHLEKLMRQSPCPRTRLRAEMVLMSAQGYSVEEIARVTQRSGMTVRRWLNRFVQSGCEGMAEGAHTGRPPTITTALEQELRRCVLGSPREFGTDRPFWTTASLAKHLKRRLHVQVTDECVRQHLERVNAVCRRPTWTVKDVAKREPGYPQKRGHFPGFCGIRPGERMSTCKTRRS